MEKKITTGVCMLTIKLYLNSQSIAKPKVNYINAT